VLLLDLEGNHGASERDSPKGPEKENDDCIFCKAPLLANNYKDSVKDHCHITGKYWGAVRNACNLKLHLNPKTPIPVVFHNLQGYDGHLLMQAMARVQGK